MSLAPGASQGISLSWLDWSFPVDLTQDGPKLAFDEQGDGVGVGEYQVYVRPTDGSDVSPIRVARDGEAYIYSFMRGLSDLYLGEGLR